MPRSTAERNEGLISEFEAFQSIIRHLWTLNGEAEMKELAEAAQVSIGTLYLWKSGVTTRPRIDTLTKVARIMGYDLVLRRRRRPTLRTVN